MATSRNVTLDVAKGLTLLTLPAIHSTLFYSTTMVRCSLFGDIMAFVAEGAGAPVFMLTMGIAITLGRKKTIRQIIFRCLMLFFLGYLLNFLKFVLPTLWDGIPANLYTENGMEQNVKGTIRLLLIGDILQLAALAYFICALLYRCKYYAYWSMALVVLIIFTAPFIWRLQTNDLLGQLPLNLINGLPPACFFPLFPWLCYPLLGLAIGYYILRQRFYNRIAVLGAIIILIGLALKHFEPSNWETNFYRLGPGGSLIHMGTALIFLYLCHLLLQIPNAKNSRFIKLLSTLSKEVTLVYILQWVVVCCLLFQFGYHQIGLNRTLLAISINTSLTITLTYLWLFIRKRRKKVEERASEKKRRGE
ncbi:heparan-alpha-glucosaminide N-acetyltransferase domain-containing protein [Arachidicoccus sp.]|uniref:heparan-alpha-glucosaminide N-acetyltransferase domain-containing protein n=1 Tax=Arachidicoccus sp. TaxID=1872624 RepID=UPI003D1E3630